MARIEYVVYSPDENELINITNADNDRAEEITQETLSNPPMKMRILDVKDSTYRQYSDANIFSVCTMDENCRPVEFEESLPHLVHSVLPGWRLIGANFSFNGCFLYYINEIPKSYSSEADIQNNYEQVCISCRSIEYLKMEFVVNYADDLPARRYEAEIAYANMEATSARTCKAIVTEYLGKRKICKTWFDESEEPNDVSGYPCHIVKY